MRRQRLLMTRSGDRPLAIYYVKLRRCRVPSVRRAFPLSTLTRFTLVAKQLELLCELVPTVATVDRHENAVCENFQFVRDQTTKPSLNVNLVTGVRTGRNPNWELWQVLLPGGSPGAGQPSSTDALAFT